MVIAFNSLVHRYLTCMVKQQVSLCLHVCCMEVAWKHTGLIVSPYTTHIRNSSIVDRCHTEAIQSFIEQCHQARVKTYNIEAATEPLRGNLQKKTMHQGFARAVL